MEERLKLIFLAVFNVDESQVIDSLSIGDIPNWDSLGHLNIITAVEEEFDIYLSNEEILELKSFKDFKNFFMEK
jgi:acyl carrier protein